MTKIDEKELLKLGKKHQKWLEDTTINLAAYTIHNRSYYLSHYASKFSTKVKAYAVISPDSQYKDEALQAIQPHIYFSISQNNLRDSTEERAKYDVSILEEIRDYIGSILDSNVLDSGNEMIYQRSFNILQSMIDLQYEMVQLWEDVKSLEATVNERGFFGDDDVEKIVHYVITTDLIQYKQFKNRHYFCRDFDVIYEKRNTPKIIKHGNSLDDSLLKGMTREAAEQQLKNSLELLTKNREVGHRSEGDIYDMWMKSYREGLDERVKQTKNMLRYP
ncbi:hypothetical protein [Virgibacillus ainsalahensis]